MVIYQFNFTLMAYIVLVQKMRRQSTDKKSGCFPEKQANKKTKENRQTKKHSLQLRMRGLFYRKYAPGQCFRVDGTAHSSGHPSPIVSSVCLHVIIVLPGLQASESHTEVLGASDAAPNSCMFWGE